MKELGTLRYFLGIEVAKSKKYTSDLLKETGILWCKLIDTPIEMNSQMKKGDGELVDKGRYQKLIRKVGISYTY